MTGKGHLTGKMIVLGVTGSIAAVETVRLCHELRRHGAEIQAVMTDAARGIINPEALTYATGRQVITACTGLVEHVSLLRGGREGRSAPDRSLHSKHYRQNSGGN